MHQRKARLTSSGSGLLRSHRGSIIAAVVVLLVAGLSGIWLPADAWGALGQWAGAFGTVLAVTVALRSSQREADAAEERRRADKIEAEKLRRADKNEAEERQRADKAERELSQARLVVAVIDYPSPELVSGPDDDDVFFVRITNYSDAHIFHPRIEGFVHQNGGTVTWDIVDPGVSSYWSAPDMLPTGETDRIPVDPRFDPPITSDMYPMRTKVIFGYTDVAGRRWRRVDQATPERVYPDDKFQIAGPDWYRADT